jgi:glutathione synthase
MALRMVFIMDPIESINIDKDSTFAMMEESGRRGHRLYYALPAGLEQAQDIPWVNAHAIRVQRDRGRHFELLGPERLNLNEVDAIFLRKDPPFDFEYLVQTYVLDRVDRRRVLLVNDPQGVRDANEKLFALHFPKYVPRTLVSKSEPRLRAFIEELGDAVVKPLAGAGGSGVVRLVKGDKNIPSILEILTRGGKETILAQAYLPNVVQGDRRVVLIDGEPVGVVNRRPRSDDLRSNMHVGGTAERATLTERDREICRALEPELVRRGLLFVGIDVIDGWLTEINVTSPTGIQEIDRFDGVCLEALLIDRVEQRVAARRLLG